MPLLFWHSVCCTTAQRDRNSLLHNRVRKLARLRFLLLLLEDSVLVSRGAKPTSSTCVWELQLGDRHSRQATVMGFGSGEETVQGFAVCPMCCICGGCCRTKVWFSCKYSDRCVAHLVTCAFRNSAVFLAQQPGSRAQLSFWVCGGFAPSHSVAPALPCAQTTP